MMQIRLIRKETAMNHKLKCYQQGDVLLFEVAEIPKNAILVPQAEHQNILQRGEVTGHAHRVDGFMEMYRESTKGQDRVFMDFPRRICLTHEEHENQENILGKYFLGHVREMDHITQEGRRVKD